MMKPRPSLPRAPLSHGQLTSGRSRSASSLTAPSADIFSVQERMIFEDNTDSYFSMPLSSNSASRYRPSPFRPRSDSHSSSVSTASSSSSVSTMCHSPTSPRPFSQTPAKVRAMSTTTNGFHSSMNINGPRSDLISTFSGPARPRRPPIVTTRHSSGMASRGDSEIAMPLDAFPGVDLLGGSYVPPKPLPDPVIFDGPAQPRRQVPPAQRKKGVTVDKAITQAGVVAGLVGLGLGGAYEIYDAQESSRHDKASKSTCRKNVPRSEPQNASKFFLEDEESDAEDVV